MTATARAASTARGRRHRDEFDATPWPIALLWIGRTSDAPVGEMFLNGLRSLVVFGSITVGAFFATIALPADVPILRLAVGVAAVLVNLLRRRRGPGDRLDLSPRSEGSASPGSG